MDHVMIDIETMGDSAGDVIVSIGAVQFNLETGETGKEFFREIKWSSCLNVGLTVKASTICWWLEQSEEARAKVIKAEKDGLHIEQVLHGLRWFLKNDLKGDLKIWGNSNRFDLGILGAAYTKIFPGAEIPWDFRNERDVRTISAYYPEIKKNMPFEGIQHDPIADCKYQIKYLCATHEQMKSPRYIVGPDPTQMIGTVAEPLKFNWPLPEKDIKEYSEIPHFEWKSHNMPTRPGIDGSQFYLPLNKPFEAGDIITTNPYTKNIQLFIACKLEKGNTVELISDEPKSSFFPPKYLTTGTKFYKI